MTRRPSTASAALEHKQRFSREIPLPTPLITKTHDMDVEAPSKTARPKSRKGTEHSTRDDSTIIMDLPTPDTEERQLMLELAHRNAPRNHPPFILKNGKRHHPFSPKSVPYPRSYERAILDHEQWECLVYQQILGGLTYHRFASPPARVLDLGCGTGAWILSAARQWKNSHFYGLDIVPLHPDLRRTGQHDLAKRVTWVHGNILETFPFPDNYFDFVRVQRVSRAIPEDKVAGFIDEVVRVLKRGAFFETMDEDLTFPGTSHVEDENEEKQSPDFKQLRLASGEVPPDDLSPGQPAPSTKDTLDRYDKRSSLSAPRGITSISQDTLDSQVSADLVFAKDPSLHDDSDCEGLGLSDRKPIHSRSSSTHARSRTGHGDNKSRKRSVSVTRALGVFHDTSSHEGAPIGGPSAPRMNQVRSISYSSGLEPANRSSGDLDIGRMNIRAPYEPNMRDSRHADAISRSESQQNKSRGSLSVQSKEGEYTNFWMKDDETESRQSSNYHNPLTQPLNPRDHSLLERIYREMHAARFINLQPLSGIYYGLSMAFSPVYGHPPFMLTFPPKPSKRCVLPSSDSWSDELESLLPTSQDRESGYAIIQMAQKRVRSSRKGGAPSASTRQSLMRADDIAAQYVMVDEARMPSSQPTRTKSKLYGEAGSTGTGASSEKLASPTAHSLQSQHSLLSEIEPFNPVDPLHNGLMPSPVLERQNSSNDGPNSPASPLSVAKVADSLEVDLKTLHLHLSLRIAETLGCAESMWEWVIEEQARYHANVQRTRMRGGPPPSSVETNDPYLDAIRKMTRADFDSCLSRFSMDMQDKIALPHALDMHLGLRPNFAPSVDAERRGFDMACAAWDAGLGVEFSDGATQKSAGGSAIDQNAKFLSRTFRVISCVKPNWA